MECAGVIFENSGRLLLQLRANSKNINNPNLWGIFGGFMEQGETPEQAVIREIKEELDITLNKRDIKFVAKIEYGGLIRYIFRSSFPIDFSKVTLNEGQDMEFFSLDEIFQSDKIIPVLKPILRKYFV